ncbi:zinc finger CCHC domain-containing protein 7-like [Scophthalmus maximus]|uniref:zinc finger CCHC domain-containing protein 7-like n=1 Tax=Scophthalmus maximus TaxID=52904 RepID=UPI000F38C794|nr:zinc finger CCHC domain-containing protein 7-like [Scophthalmus maximus]XP_047190547.1 zinc finger CCHC domain-containing protein 7-like [Scophthalmus maximus]
MDFKQTEEGDGGEAGAFVEDYCSSDDDGGAIGIGDQKHQSSCKQAAGLSGESSPPLLLAFSITSGRALEGSSPGTASQEEEEEEEDREQPVEEWMILGGEEQVGDSSIHLNLGYWSSSEEESGVEDPNVKSVKDTWAVSEKDKWGSDQSLSSRYFVPGRYLTCNICNRTGHLAKSCYYHKKCPTCVLCGIQGHIQRDCPCRPCPICGLPLHGLRPCEKPPIWNQLCQRCGMTGHLSDNCPDTWRQYHLTIRLEVPLRPWRVNTTLKHKRCFAYCYNCSKRGHYGFECTKSRMTSGTFPTLPHVYHYDTVEEILQQHTKMQKRVKERAGAGSEQYLSEATGEICDENQPVQARSRIKQETCSRAGRRKTWPERRRERQEVKRLRREAQARREGGLLGRSRGNYDDEACQTDPFKSPCHGHRLSTSPPQKKKRDEAGCSRSRKSREAQRWKRRGGLKRGDLYPHSDVDIRGENFLSPKQRVRHRRR